MLWKKKHIPAEAITNMYSIDQLEEKLQRLKDAYINAKDLSSRVHIMRMIDEVEKELETRKAA